MRAPCGSASQRHGAEPSLDWKPWAQHFTRMQCANCSGMKPCEPQDLQKMYRDHYVGWKTVTNLGPRRNDSWAAISSCSLSEKVVFSSKCSSLLFQQKSYSILYTAVYSKSKLSFSFGFWVVNQQAEDQARKCLQPVSASWSCLQSPHVRKHLNYWQLGTAWDSLGHGKWKILDQKKVKAGAGNS